MKEIARRLLAIVERPIFSTRLLTTMIVAAALFLGVWALTTGWFVVTGERPFGSRTLTVAVDSSLTADGAWPLGSTEVRTDAINERVEVTILDRTSERLAIHVRRQPTRFASELDLVIQLRDSGVPDVDARGLVRDMESGSSWPYRNAGGVVTLSTDSAAAISRDALVLAYDLEGDCSGSPVRWTGKVALGADGPK